MKGRRVLPTLIAASALLCLITPATAQAANTTCANADFVFPGERAQYTIGASGSLFFKGKVTSSRSYAVIAWGPFQDTGEGGVSLSVDLFSDSACTTTIPGADTSDTEPIVFNISGHSGDHDNVIAQADGTVWIRVNNSIASAYVIHVLFIETTIFSPWWFNGGTNNAFIEVRNNMNTDTSAEVTLYRSNGAVCGTTSVPLAANGNAALIVGLIGTCAGGSGSAQIAFAGTPGGLVANITTIDGPNGTSFDSPFSPRMVWSTFSR